MNPALIGRGSVKAGAYRHRRYQGLRRSIADGLALAGASVVVSSQALATTPPEITMRTWRDPSLFERTMAWVVVSTLSRTRAGIRCGKMAVIDLISEYLDKEQFPLAGVAARSWPSGQRATSSTSRRSANPGPMSGPTRRKALLINRTKCMAKEWRAARTPRKCTMPGTFRLRTMRGYYKFDAEFSPRSAGRLQRARRRL